MAINSGVYYIINAETKLGVTPDKGKPEAGAKVVTPQTAKNRFAVPPTNEPNENKIEITQVEASKLYKLESYVDTSLSIAHDGGSTQCANGHLVTTWKQNHTDTWEIDQVLGGAPSLYTFKVPNKDLYACTDNTNAPKALQPVNTNLHINDTQNGNFPLCVRLTEDSSLPSAHWFVYPADPN